MAKAIRRSAGHALRLESLETRTLLAADLPSIGVTDVTPDSQNVGFEPVREIEFTTDVAGDVNLDSVVDAKDINVMGVVLRTGDQTKQFDIDSNGVVEKADLDMLVHDILGSQYGDADLNGVVNYRDLGLWQLNMFQQNAGWTGGDFNGDGFSDVHDFNVWNANRGSGTLNAVNAGDFDSDGNLTAIDIDMLSAAIRSQSQEPGYDLDGSGVVDKSDMDMMVHELIGTYYGDATLDGQVNNDDFRAWQGNVFSDSTGWEMGDFNGDGVTDVLDFNLWNNHKGLGDEVDPTNSSLVADFNNDGLTDAQDIDMLHAAISSSSENLMFDLTGDLAVDKSDSIFMVQDVLETRFADANLDGIIDSLDFTRWSINRFQTGTGWASGDFNGDGVTDVADYNIWNNLRDDGFGTVVPASAGDVNADGVVDSEDIDAVHEAIRAQSSDPGFDLNGDGNVSKADSETLVYDVIGTKYGDTNLDGFVDFFDHAELFGNIFTLDAGWGGGDFNGDGFTDVLDFNIWNSSRDVGFQTVQPTAGELDGLFSSLEDADQSHRVAELDALFSAY